MKDYAKLASKPREKRTSEHEPAKAQAKPNLVKTAKELQPKEEEGGKNIFARVLILGIIIIVGYGVAHQYLATHHIDLSTGKITTALKQAKSAAIDNSSTSQQGNAPQFDFYTVLPKGNAPANAPASSTNTSSSNSNSSSSTNANQPTSTQTAPAPTATTPSAPPANAAPVTTIPVSTGTKYYLDVGNYPNNNAAQQIASDLSSMNISASINPIQSNNGTVYSVMAGPYPDQATMSIVRTQLSAHDINTSVVQTN